MTFYWMILIGFICSLSALPQVIKRLQRKKEAADILQLIGTIALAAAIVCYTIDLLS